MASALAVAGPNILLAPYVYSTERAESKSSHASYFRVYVRYHHPRSPIRIPWSPYSSPLPHPPLSIRLATEATRYALGNCLSTDFALLLQPNAYAYGVRYMVAQMVEW